MRWCMWCKWCMFECKGWSVCLGLAPIFKGNVLSGKPVLVVFVFMKDANKVGFGFSGNCQCGLSYWLVEGFEFPTLGSWWCDEHAIDADIPGAPSLISCWYIVSFPLRRSRLLLLKCMASLWLSIAMWSTHDDCAFNVLQGFLSRCDIVLVWTFDISIVNSRSY